MQENQARRQTNTTSSGKLSTERYSQVLSTVLLQHITVCSLLHSLNQTNNVSDRFPIVITDLNNIQAFLKLVKLLS